MAKKSYYKFNVFTMARAMAYLGFWGFIEVMYKIPTGFFDKLFNSNLTDEPESVEGK